METHLCTDSILEFMEAVAEERLNRTHLVGASLGMELGLASGQIGSKQF